jgi:formiminotetrahydrofolate cyclodeaminase
MPAPITSTLREFLDRLASPAPVPGGGAAAALTGTLGVSLLLMVASMEKTRTNAPEEVADLAAAAARLRPVREELTSLIEEDSQAYVEVLIAFKLPRETDAEKTARQTAIQRALQLATDVPLRTMRLCETALRDAPVVVRFGNPNAATDAAVGARLLLAALESAGVNVDVNLPGIKDADYVRTSSDERQALLASARQFAAQTQG